MRNLSIEEIEKYYSQSIQLEELTKLSSWDDLTNGDVIIKLKLAYVLLVKILKDMEILSKDYNTKLELGNHEENEEIVAEDHFEFIPSFGKLYYELTKTVYESQGWDIEEINIFELVKNVAYAYEFELDEDGYCSELSSEMIRDWCEGYLEESFLTICGDSLLTTLELTTQGSIIGQDFYLFKNKKIAKLRKLLKSNQLWNNSKIVTRINEIIKNGVSPLQINILECTIREDIYSEEFIFSMLLFESENGEFVESAHFQLSKVINVVLLNQLVDIVISQIEGMPI